MGAKIANAPVLLPAADQSLGTHTVTGYGSREPRLMDLFRGGPAFPRLTHLPLSGSCRETSADMSEAIDLTGDDEEEEQQPHRRKPVVEW